MFLLIPYNAQRHAQILLSYVLSSGGLIDLVSCLPAFGAFQPWMSSLAFIRYNSFIPF